MPIPSPNQNPTFHTLIVILTPSLSLDIAYTYYNGPKDTVLNDTTALALQHYLTSFAKTGVPSASGVPHFPLYGNDSEVLNLNLSSITEMKDPSANERCAWWQKGLVY